MFLRLGIHHSSVSTRFFEKEDLVTKTTSRRDLIKAAAVGSVAAGLGLKSHAVTRAEEAAQNPNDHEHHLGPVDGPYATPPSASVLFLPILTTSWIAVPIGHPITATFTC